MSESPNTAARRAASELVPMPVADGSPPWLTLIRTSSGLAARPDVVAHMAAVEVDNAAGLVRLTFPIGRTAFSTVELELQRMADRDEFERKQGQFDDAVIGFSRLNSDKDRQIAELEDRLSLYRANPTDPATPAEPAIEPEA